MTSPIKSFAASILFTACSSLTAQAEISPDIRALLRLAATEDQGKNLADITALALKINPDQADEIRTFVASLTPQTPASVVQEETPSHYGYFTFKGWDGDVELNLLNSSGNTQNTSIGLGGSLKRETEDFSHLVNGFFDFNKNSGIKDKQKWGLGYKLDFNLSKRSYISTFAGYDNDQFGPFRERFTLSSGYGYHILKGDTFNWSMEAGPSVLLTKELPGQSYLTELTGFASSHFEWAINERSHLDNNTGVFLGARNVIDSKSALTVKINGALSSKFSFDILYDKDAPLSRKKTDTIARAGLLYDF